MQGLHHHQQLVTVCCRWRNSHTSTLADCNSYCVRPTSPTYAVVQLISILPIPKAGIHKCGSAATFHPPIIRTAFLTIPLNEKLNCVVGLAARRPCLALRVDAS